MGRESNSKQLCRFAVLECLVAGSPGDMVKRATGWVKWLEQAFVVSTCAYCKEEKSVSGAEPESFHTKESSKSLFLNFPTVRSLKCLRQKLWSLLIIY